MLFPAEAALGFADDEVSGLSELWMGGTSTDWTPLLASIWALILAATAATAAARSTGVLGLLSAEGLRADLESGLRLLRESDSCSLETGDRDLRSNREFLRGSGSVWSKRDRFRGTSSGMSTISGRGHEEVKERVGRDDRNVTRASFANWSMNRLWKQDGMKLIDEKMLDPRQAVEVATAV